MDPVTRPAVSSQTKVGGAIHFHVEIRIADDELKRRVVRARKVPQAWVRVGNT
jgi:hypothetical protein